MALWLSNKKLFCHSARLTTIADNIVIGVVGNTVIAPPIRVRGMLALLEPVGHAVIGVNYRDNSVMLLL